MINEQPIARIKALLDWAILHRNLHEKSHAITTGVNIFDVIDHGQHRETTHSKILQCLLDPLGPHQEGPLFLMLFLRLLRKLESRIPERQGIEKTLLWDMGKVEVKLELSTTTVDQEGAAKMGSIDLLLRHHSLTGTEAIIIENKIRGAGATYRQLPRYIRALTDDNVTVLAIVQINGPWSAAADVGRWGYEENDHTQIDALTLQLAATGHPDDLDLANGWLAPSETQLSNLDALTLVRPYRLHLSSMGNYHMSYTAMRAFVDRLQNPEERQALAHLDAMCNELPDFLLDDFLANIKENKAPWECLNPSLYEDLQVDRKNKCINFIPATTNKQVNIAFYLYRCVTRCEAMMSLYVGDCSDLTTFNHQVEQLLSMPAIKLETASCRDPREWKFHKKYDVLDTNGDLRQAANFIAQLLEAISSTSP